MKIAFLTKHFNFRNGSSRSIHETANRLVSRGHEPHIFCNSSSDGYSGGAVIRHIPMMPLGSWSKVFSFDMGCRLRLRSAGMDIVHGQGNTTNQDILTVRVCRKANRLARGLGLSRWDPHLLLEQRQFEDPRLKIIISLSEKVRTDLIGHYGIARDKIRVIPNGVDANRFRPSLRELLYDEKRRDLGLSRKDYVLLFVASGNFKNRGLDNLLLAFRRLPSDSARLLIVGGDRSSSYRLAAREFGIEKRVLFLPFSQSLEKIHAIADALIFPSHYDTFGNVPLEAMASGLPVIVTASCGMSSLIRDGENGFVLGNASDIEGMVKLMRGLADPALRLRIGSEARKTAEQQSWDEVASKTLQLYEDLMASRSA